MMFRFVKLVFIVSLLSGCAMVDLNDETKNSIRTYNINEEVTMVGAAYYNGPEGALAGLGGLVGLASALEGDEARATNSDLIDALIKENNIDIKAMVLQNFKEKIAKHPDFGIKTMVSADEDADVTFNLSVNRYGIGLSAPLSNEFRPVVLVFSELNSKSGEKIWANFSHISEFNSDTAKVPYEEYFKSPELFRDGMQDVIARSIEELIGLL